jgi:hypothetical protein
LWPNGRNTRASQIPSRFGIMVLLAFESCEKIFRWTSDLLPFRERIRLEPTDTIIIHRRILPPQIGLGPSQTLNSEDGQSRPKYKSKGSNCAATSTANVGCNRVGIVAPFKHCHLLVFVDRSSSSSSRSWPRTTIVTHSCRRSS